MPIWIEGNKLKITQSLYNEVFICLHNNIKNTESPLFGMEVEVLQDDYEIQRLKGLFSNYNKINTKPKTLYLNRRTRRMLKNKKK